MPMYESEHTRFMREWLDKHPEELAVRERGRALWWDRPQDSEAQRRLAEAKVPPRPYAYQSEI